MSEQPDYFILNPISNAFSEPPIKKLWTREMMNDYHWKWVLEDYPIKSFCKPKDATSVADYSFHFVGIKY